jgi:hypothetical protein
MNGDELQALIYGVTIVLCVGVLLGILLKYIRDNRG